MTPEALRDFLRMVVELDPDELREELDRLQGWSDEHEEARYVLSLQQMVVMSIENAFHALASLQKAEL